MNTLPDASTWKWMVGRWNFPGAIRFFFQGFGGFCQGKHFSRFHISQILNAFPKFDHLQQQYLPPKVIAQRPTTAFEVDQYEAAISQFYILWLFYCLHE